LAFVQKLKCTQSIPTFAAVSMSAVGVHQAVTQMAKLFK
jgi:hypothetical protein